MSIAQSIPLWPLALGGLFALICLIGAMRAGSRKRLIDNLPTSKTTGVFIGLVELKGTAESEAPLTSYLAACRCVHYAWTIEEHWSRTVTETYTDSDGKTKTRTRHESGWTNVGRDGGMIPFYLLDDCGTVLIQPAGAKIEPSQVFDTTCGRADPLYYGKGPGYAVSDSDHRRRFVESAIPIHAETYVIGQARERQDVVAAEIASDPQAPLFLISTRSEDRISSGFGWAFWGWGIFGFILALAGVGVGVHMGGRNPAEVFPLFVFAAAGYGMAAWIGWVWMVFNNMVDLRQRVRQGWSQVEVQLKRRHDLINNLVNTVRGLRDYERETQVEIAALRSQLEATPPGVVGPDYKACTKVVIAVAESYPELKSNEAFSRLQQNLIDTEQRIALARSYFNDIATHYNTRLEIIPDRFIARLAALQPQALMAANDFERAPIEVQLVN